MLFFVISMGACTKQDDHMCGDESGTLQEKDNPAAVPIGNPLSQSDLDKVVVGTLESRNDFQWEWVDLKTLWSALQYNDHSLAIGYKLANEGDISSKIHKVNVKSGAYKEVHDALLVFILDELNKSLSDPITLDQILIEDDPILPIITIRLTDKNVLTKLYNLRNVRYLEPLDYWPANAQRVAASGCSASTQALTAADYTTITPGALLPWNFNNHSIPAAWNNSQGQGVTIGLIDAGISASQSLLGAQFNSGDSNVGRTITTGYTLGTSAYNSCLD